MAQQSKKPSLADPNVSAAEYMMFLGRDYTAQARVVEHGRGCSTCSYELK